jgi:hypothetical protein
MRRVCIGMCLAVRWPGNEIFIGAWKELPRTFQPGSQRIALANMGLLEECELPMDILKGIIPFEAFVIGYSGTQRLVLVEPMRNKLSDELIRNEADNHCDRKRDCSKDEA